jgi:DNA-binding MarR family transcriptional regulator
MLPNKTKAELALNLGRAMAELRVLLRQQIQEKIKENGVNLTFEMLEVLSCLWRRDGIIQQEIADYTLRDKSSLTYLLDNLVKRKLVSRVEDGNDRRNKLIFLTQEGLALKDQLYPWAMEVYQAASEKLDETALETAVAVLNQMTVALKKP